LIVVLLMWRGAGVGDSERRYQYGYCSESMRCRHTSSKSSSGWKASFHCYRRHLGRCSRTIVNTVCRHPHYAIPNRSSSTGQL